MDLDRPIAIALFALSLYGCGPDASRQVDRVRAAGVDVVHSTTTVHAGRTRFECVRSSSGACHYVVRRPGCTVSTVTRDVPRCAPLHEFAIGERAARDLAGLQRFDVCVGDDARADVVCRRGPPLVKIR